MKRGLSFEIPNEYGRFLGEIIEAYRHNSIQLIYRGRRGHFVENDTLGKPLFSGEIFGLGSEHFKGIIDNNEYYVISANFEAYPKDKNVDIRTYEEFLKSDCQLALIVID